MAGLPKKYAKMGFKKGWRAFKALKSKSKKRTVRASPRRAKKTTRRVTTVARKKKTYRKSSRGGLLTGTSGQAITAFGYGALRNGASRMAQKYLGANMAGQYADNVVLGGVGLLGTMYGRGIVKKAGQAMLNAEAFLAGIKAGSRFGNGSASSSSSSGSLF